MVSNNRELKKLSLAFRSVASRALRSDEDDARANLRRLLTFVREQPLLAAEIARAPAPSVDAATLWSRAQEQGSRLELPDDPVEELGVLHAALAFLVESPQQIFALLWGYAGERDRSDYVSEALHDVAGKYVDHLQRVIEIALLDSTDTAYGPARGISVHVSGGTNQVNVASDQAQLRASQALGADAAALVERVLGAMRELERVAATDARSTTEREDVEEISRAVIAELQHDQPRRFTLKAAKDRLQVIAASTTAAQTIATHASAALTWLGPLVERLQHAVQ